MRLIILLFLIIPTSLFAFENPKVKINNFYIQKYEVTISEFSNFANKTNFKTEAEKQGFGYEYGAGWEKRKAISSSDYKGYRVRNIGPNSAIDHIDLFRNQPCQIN